MITRAFVKLLLERMSNPAPLIQAVVGPRQVGKTTGVLQMLKKYPGTCHYVSADDTLTVSNRWIQEQWQAALEKGSGTVLVIDEIQKIQHWSEALKRLWDAQKRTPGRLKCILLGSSALTLQTELTESLTGRFEMVPVHHWSFLETQKAFGDNLDTYLWYGGYPGSHTYQSDYPRWFSYIKSSIVDTVIGQDILTQQTVAKPALFRQAFEILCGYPAQEVSYTTLLGQLHDKGNTDLVKHYLELYEGAFLFKGLMKYSGRVVNTKTSSPKIIPLCPAFYTLAAGRTALDAPEKMGHVFEALVGADLVRWPDARVFYWREGNAEVDYVVMHESDLYAIEVKSGRSRAKTGLTLFKQRFPKARTAFVTRENYEKFVQSPLDFLNSVATSA